MKMPALLTSVSTRPKRARLGDHALGRLGIGDVAGDREHVVVAGRLDRARGGDDPVVPIAIGLDEGGADALRGAGDDCDFLLGTHGSPFLCVVRQWLADCDGSRPKLVRGASEYALIERHSFTLWRECAVAGLRWAFARAEKHQSVKELQERGQDGPYWTR